MTGGVNFLRTILATALIAVEAGLCAALLWRFAPETKGRTLEDISRSW